MALELIHLLEDKAKLTWFSLGGITVRERTDALQRAVAERVCELREQYSEPIAASAVIRSARELYRSLGIDPSKRRPSSEALLRRVLQSKTLYTVNTAVDAANLASLSFFLPVGLYDLDRIDGPVTFRTGREGEEYAGIGKGTIHLEGRPALVDASGPFGNPSSDSFRTRVTLDTVRLLFVIFAPVGYPAEQMPEHRGTAVRILREHVAGEVEAVG